MKNLLVVIMLIFSASTLFAQIQFKSGYIITLDGDTLFGEIDYQDDNVLARQCRFRENPQSQSQIFYPLDIAGYRFTDGKYFVSKEVDGTSYFLEYLLNGAISLYTRQDNKKKTYFYIDKEDVGIVEITYESKILHIKEDSYESSSTKHIGVLQYFMQDADALGTQITAIKAPTRRNLMRLTENYHNMVCDSVECVIYAKKMSRVIFNPQLVFGSTYFSSRESFLLSMDKLKSPYKALSNIPIEESPFFSDNLIIENSVVPTYGLLLHISSPYVSDKLYLKTGLLVSSYNNKFNYNIPFQIEYLYPVGVVRPRISLGLNIPKFNPAISAGVWFVLNNKLSITTDYDLTLNNILNLYRYNYLSHTFYAGVRINI